MLLKLHLQCAVAVLALALCSQAHAQRAELLAKFSVDGLKYIDMSHDGRYVVTVGSDSLTRIWNTETGVQVGALNRIHHDDRPQRDDRPQHDVIMAAFLPGDSTVLTYDAFDSTFQVWDWRMGMLLRNVPIHRPVFYARVLEDGSTLAIWVYAPKYRLEFWSIATGEFLKSPFEGVLMSHLSWFNHAGTQFLGYSFPYNYLENFDPRTHEYLSGYGHGTFPGGFSPDDQRIVCGWDSATVMVYNARTLDTLFSFNLFSFGDISLGQAAYQTLYDPRGEWILTLGRNQSRVILQRWRPDNGAFIDTVAIIDSAFLLTPNMIIDPSGEYVTLYTPGIQLKAPIVTLGLHRPVAAAPAIDPGIATLSVVPNPVRTWASIPMAGHPLGSVRCSIVDVAGMTIRGWVQSLSGSDGQSIRFDVGDLAGGVYFCRLQWENQARSVAFVVQR
ncbi:MAG: repeat-like protein [Chlorobi bacterium]|nr:repeat-like protein [Chlorobiota bacterium]